MDITARIVADSVSRDGVRMTSVECVHPRFILAEVNTHRALSKNGASSRAIPLKKQIEMLRTHAAEPSRWLLNAPGMVATTFMPEDDAEECRAIWFEAMEDAIRHAERLAAKNASKQYVNRILEPFMMQRTLLSGTDWNNFRALRWHPDAQPEFFMLADAIQAAMEFSTPVLRCPTSPEFDQWHLPYITAELKHRIQAMIQDAGLYSNLTILAAINLLPADLPIEVRIALVMSAAMCAGVSYRTVDGVDMSPEKAASIFGKLIVSQPVHASPVEHQAKVGSFTARSGNLRGWHQFRQLIPNNVIPG